MADSIKNTSKIHNPLENINSFMEKNVSIIKTIESLARVGYYGLPSHVRDTPLKYKAGNSVFDLISVYCEFLKLRKIWSQTKKVNSFLTNETKSDSENELKSDSQSPLDWNLAKPLMQKFFQENFSTLLFLSVLDSTKLVIEMIFKSFMGEKYQDNWVLFVELIRFIHSSKIVFGLWKKESFLHNHKDHLLLTPTFTSLLNIITSNSSNTNTSPQLTNYYEEELTELQSFFPVSSKQHSSNSPTSTNSTNKKQVLSIWIFLYKILDLLHPLIYVLAIRLYGKQSWKPWILSLLLEKITRQLISRGPDDSLSECAEKDLQKRNSKLFKQTFLRSPFFELLERMTPQSIIELSKQIPSIHSILVMVFQYIKNYREYHFFVNG